MVLLKDQQPRIFNNMGEMGSTLLEMVVLL